MARVRVLMAMVVIVAAAAFATVAVDTPAASGQPPVEHTTTVRWGPFMVPPGGGHGGHGGSGLHNIIVREGGCISFGLDTCFDTEMTKPCEDCFITRIVPNLVDPETGESINFDNGGMLHHVVNVNFSKPDPICAPSGDGDLINLLGAFEGGNERWFASGNERTIMDLPDGYGMPVSASDDWGLIMHLMNMTDEHKMMSFEFTFDWVESGVAPVTPLWWDIDQCGDSEVNLPAGYSDTQWDWTSPMSGEIVTLAGHIHNHGISMAARNATSGETICTSLAGYGVDSPHVPVAPGPGTDDMHPASWLDPLTESDHPDVSLGSYMGNISAMSGCDPFTRVNAGDVIETHTQYQLDEPDPGAMGIMIVFLAQDQVTPTSTTTPTTAPVAQAAAAVTPAFTG